MYFNMTHLMNIIYILILNYDIMNILIMISEPNRVIQQLPFIKDIIFINPILYLYFQARMVFFFFFSNSPFVMLFLNTL